LGEAQRALERLSVSLRDSVQKLAQAAVFGRMLELDDARKKSAGVEHAQLLD